MRGSRASLSSVPMRAVKLGFWGIFGVTAALSYLIAGMVNYHYDLAISTATYSSVLQGLGLMVAASALGVFLRRGHLGGEIRGLEERTLREVNRRLGWTALAWDTEFERRVEGEAPSYQVQVPSAPLAAVPPVPTREAPPAPIAAEAPAPRPQRKPSGPGTEALESELDELLETIMVDEGGEGTPPPPQEAQAQPAQPEAVAPVLPPPIPVAPEAPMATVAVRTDDLREALRQHRHLAKQRRDLVAHLVHPLAMNGGILALCAFALPSAAGFLAADSVLNTTVIFLSTYGAVVSVGFTALMALRVLRP